MSELRSYGAGWTSYLRRHEHKIVVVAHPDRRMRRLKGKSDTLDAENTARSILARLRPRGLTTPQEANRDALKRLAKRWLVLDAEAKELHTMIEDLVKQQAPQLLDAYCIGVDTAAEILVVGDTSERVHSEAALAKLAGISPIPAGSGVMSG